MTPMLDAALSYARRGWRVLPVAERGKQPLGALVPNGVRNATLDEATIRGWWAKQPAGNLGIATGSESGLLVIDLDGEAGEQSWKTLREQHGFLPRTPISETGNGLHVLLKHPGGVIPNRVSLLAGIDVRGDAGYICAPPSVHPSGQRYAWGPALTPERVALAPAPEWLLSLIRERSATSNGAKRGGGEVPDIGALPAEWPQRLLADPRLRELFFMEVELSGADQSPSAFALATANRLVRVYPTDSDGERLAVLREFYRLLDRSVPASKLVLTLEKAKERAIPSATTVRLHAMHQRSRATRGSVRKVGT